MGLEWRSAAPVSFALDDLATVAEQVPADADLDALVLVFWHGADWVEVDASPTTNSDGSLLLTAQAMHFPLFGVIWAPADWGTFSPTPIASGVTLSAWRGGGYSRPDAPLGEGDSVWLFADGRATGYLVGVPAFVNQAFVVPHPDGLPIGALVIVSRRPQ